MTGVIVDIRNASKVIVAMAIIFLSACTKEPSFVEKPMPEVILGAGDSRLSQQTIRLSADTVYVLATNVMVNDGQVLTIDAGTLIKVNDRLAVTIYPGGVIEANGRANAPVVFTSSAFTGGAGIGGGGIVSSVGSHFWYGIRIYGNAQSQPGKSSGKLSYVRVEFAGGNDNNAYVSFLLQDVDKATVLDNVQVSYSFATSSFEINGGNFNAKHLVSYASSASDFVIRNGYNGMLQHLLSWRHPYFPSSSGYIPGYAIAGVLIEDNTTFPLLSNITVIGPLARNETSITYTEAGKKIGALVARTGARFRIRNSVFMGFPQTAFYLDDKNTGISLINVESEFAWNIVQSVDSTRTFYLPSNVYPPFTSQDFKNYMMEPPFHNEIYTSESSFQFANAFEYDVNPDPLPQSGSPILSGAAFEGAFSDAFFEKVAWRGGVGSATQNWMQGWTNFKPLQTNYNN